MRKVIVGIFTGLMMICAVGANAASDPVGVVDYQKVGQAISFQELFKTKMETAMGTSRQDMETLTKAMQEKQKQLDDKNAKLTDAQKKELTDTVAQQKKKLTDMQTESQKKMMTVRTDLGNDLKKKLEESVARVAAKHNISAVFLSNSLAYAANKVDITDELIADLASAFGVKPVSASEQAPGMRPGMRPGMMRPGMPSEPAAR